MAIAVILSGDSSVYSGGNHCEGLRISLNVCFQHHLFGGARKTHPRHPFERRIPGKLSRGIRRKLEHIAACCGTLSRLARVLGAWQRNELKSAVDNGLARTRRSPTRLTLETQNEQRSAFRANYLEELLDSNSTLHSLKPENRLAWTPWTQIIREKKHMELLDKKGRRPGPA